MGEPESPLHELGDVATQVATRARDAAYTAVGLGVLGLQRAQARRQEMARRTPDLPLDAIRSLVAERLDQIDHWLDTTLHAVESALRPIEDQLPPQARDLAGMAIDGCRELGAQLRQLVSPGS